MSAETMTADSARTAAEKLVAHIKAGTELQGLDELYDPDAVSVEAMAMPGENSAELRGVEAIKGKHAWWNANFELHDAKVEGPYHHGSDRFAMIFALETTNKNTGERSSMQEVAIYTVGPDGKIVREEFFYG